MSKRELAIQHAKSLLRWASWAEKETPPEGYRSLVFYFPSGPRNFKNFAEVRSLAKKIIGSIK